MTEPPNDPATTVVILDLPLGDERWTAALPVLQELRPSATRASIAGLLELDDPQGVRFLGAFDDGRCLGVAGYRVLMNTSSGRKLYIDDLVTAAHQRSTGIGHRLMSELRRRATELDCTTVDLDSGVQRYDAHRFYLRERMQITAHHFGLHL